MSPLGKWWTGWQWPFSQRSLLASTRLCFCLQPLMFNSAGAGPSLVLFLPSIWKSPFKIRSLFTECWKELWPQKERAHGAQSKETFKCKHLDSCLGPLPQCNDSLKLWQTLLISHYFLWAACWIIWWSICFSNVGDWGGKEKRTRR